MIRFLLIAAMVAGVSTPAMAKEFDIAAFARGFGLVAQCGYLDDTPKDARALMRRYVVHRRNDAEAAIFDQHFDWGLRKAREMPRACEWLNHRWSGVLDSRRAVYAKAQAWAAQQ